MNPTTYPDSVIVREIPSYRIRIVSFLAVFLVGMFALVGLAGTATAHDEVTKTTPADGAVLNAVPESVSVTFSSSQLQGAAKLVAISDNGRQVQLTNVTVADTVVSAPWPQTEPAGTYKVSWRSVGSDGHALTGTFGFTYRTPNAGPSAPPASGSPDVTILASSPAAQPTQATSSFPWWIVGVVLIVIVGVVVIIVSTRKNSNKPPTQ